MGTASDSIGNDLRAFITAQRVFFVATAPSTGGHVNLSPKGLDTLRIIDGRTVAYLDYVGSGAETIAHLKDNGRIVLMLCAFQGSPKIVRLHGHGEALEPQQSEFAALRALFPAHPPARGIIRIHIERIADSCGYGVPIYAFESDRSQLEAWSDRKGEDGLRAYQKNNNRTSLDGLPALEWTQEHTGPTMTRRPVEGEFASFYAGYIASVPERDVLPVLESQPADLRALGSRVAGRDTFRYKPDKWTILQTFGHLIDTESVMGYRAFCIGRGEEKPLPGFDQNDYVAGADSGERSATDMAHEFAAVRHANLWTIRRWTPEEWSRVGNANGHPISARAIAYVMAGHVRHHMAILRDRYGLA